MPNNVYLKGFGDSEPECTIDPTDAQIVAAIRENPIKVAENAVKTLSMELQSALVTLAKYDEVNELLVVLSDSAKDLLHRECI